MLGVKDLGASALGQNLLPILQSPASHIDVRDACHRNRHVPSPSKKVSPEIYGTTQKMSGRCRFALPLVLWEPKKLWPSKLGMREYVSFCSFPNTGQHLRAPDLASPFCARPVVCSIMVVERCASRHVSPGAHHHPVFPWPTRVDPEAEISSCVPRASLILVR